MTARPGHAAAIARTIALAVVLVACREQPPASVATYLGSTIAPPRGLDRLRIGMTVDQARAAVPGLELAPDGDALVIGSGRAEVELKVKLDRDGAIDGIVMTVALPRRSSVPDPGAMAQLTRAWGEPVAENFFGLPIWASVETGWRVDANFWSAGYSLAFDAYRAVPATVFGAEPRLPGPLAPLTGDMTVEEARAAVPGLPDVVDLGVGGLRIGGDGLRSTIARDGDRFSSIVVYLPAPARPTVLAAWPGGFDSRDEDDLATTVWFDPARRWRITLGAEQPLQVTLTFEPYRPLAELIGSGPADGIPVVALALASRQKLSLPPTEWASDATSVAVFHGDHQPRSIAVLLYHGGDRDARGRMLAQLARRWGEPTLDKDGADARFVFHARSPRVVVDDDAAELVLEITLPSVTSAGRHP